jgi:hypothetical protein
MHQREHTGARMCGLGLPAASGICGCDGNGHVRLVVQFPAAAAATYAIKHREDAGVAVIVVRRARQRGTTIVEQALLLPVFLTILFGIIDMSRALYSYTYVSYIAREATRWASVRGGGINGKASQTDVQNFVRNVNGMGLDARQLSATTTWIAPPNGSPLCPGGNANEKPGCIVQVTVNYNFSFILPFMPGNPLALSSESQMVITQ